MSASGPKQTCVSAVHMSAFGGEADMTIGTCPLSRLLLGVKRTSLFAAHMSAFDPKRTWQHKRSSSSFSSSDALQQPFRHALDLLLSLIDGRYKALAMR